MEDKLSEGQKLILFQEINEPLFQQIWKSTRKKLTQISKKTALL